MIRALLCLSLVALTAGCSTAGSSASSAFGSAIRASGKAVGGAVRTVTFAETGSDYEY